MNYEYVFMVFGFVSVNGRILFYAEIREQSQVFLFPIVLNMPGYRVHDLLAIVLS